ncbi:hypothetical protein BH20VER1_BH20VER1_30470 [soil metagenome]
MTEWIELVLGGLLLFFGRTLFWVFVGVFGFLAGVRLAPYFFGGQSELILLLIALGFGLAGALLAILVQRLAIVVAGFIAGGYLAFRVAASAGWTSEPVLHWIVVFIGAVVAAVLVSLLFDWALIVLSALTGAVIISDALPWGRPAEWIVAGVLFVVGVAVQAGWRRRARSD